LPVEQRKLDLHQGEVLSAQALDGGGAYFEVVRKIAQGGEGSIYEAVTDDGQVAIVKGPLFVGTRDLSLEKEANHLAVVNPHGNQHGNVVRLLATQKDPRGHTLMFLERVFENPLRVMNRDAVRARLDAWGPRKGQAVPPISVALELGYELALGLEHLHAKGLLHGDVKPANLMVAIDWREAVLPDRVYFERLAKGRWRGVVIDLGGAKTTKELAALARGLPLVKPPKMTPAYAPPEVLPGLRDSQGVERSHFGLAIDTYAFGLTLYQLVTGQVPYAHLKAPPSDQDLKQLAHAKREERDGAHRPIAKAAVDALDWSDCALEGDDRRGFQDELWKILAQATNADPNARGKMSDLRALLGKLLGVEALSVAEAMSVRDSAGDDPRTVRPWVQRRLRLDSFTSRLTDAGRDGTQKKETGRGKIQRGGSDFWEMQGFAPK
jgi:serine/threonine protein kinase